MKMIMFLFTISFILMGNTCSSAPADGNLNSQSGSSLPIHGDIVEVWTPPSGLSLYILDGTVHQNDAGTIDYYGGWKVELFTDTDSIVKVAFIKLPAQKQSIAILSSDNMTFVDNYILAIQ